MQAYPPSRIRYMIGIADIVLVLTHKAAGAVLPTLALRVETVGARSVSTPASTPGARSRTGPMSPASDISASASPVRPQPM